MEIISNIIYYVVPFIVLLGILVFVHEFGHFIVARMLKVKVVAFSIGFGKELWSRTDKKGTEWKISAIPLGGYCQFLGDGDASSSTTDDSLSKLSEEDKKQAFALQSTWKKILIVVAGPLFNYLLAILLFMVLFSCYGKMTIPTYIGEVMANSAAEKAGIMVGDKIVMFNGNPTPDFSALIRETDLATQDEVEVVVERRNTLRLTAENTAQKVCGKKVEEKIIGVIATKSSNADNANENSELLPIVDSVVAGSPAEKAGLQKGDIIESINGTEIITFADLKQYVAAHQNEELEIAYRRRITLSANLQDTVTEDIPGGIKRRMLGVVSSSEYAFSKEISLSRVFPESVKETYNLTVMTLRGIGQIITGHRGGKDIGGIIRIAELSGDASKQGGLSGFIYFMALISVNLGLINLFPIPVLDGGNLVIYIIEMVSRREIKPKVKDYIFKFGLIVLLIIMLLATWNDIVHLIGRWFY